VVSGGGLSRVSNDSIVPDAPRLIDGHLMIMLGPDAQKHTKAHPRTQKVAFLEALQIA